MYKQCSFIYALWWQALMFLGVMNNCMLVGKSFLIFSLSGNCTFLNIFQYVFKPHLTSFTDAKHKDMEQTSQLRFKPNDEVSIRPIINFFVAKGNKWPHWESQNYGMTCFMVPDSEAVIWFVRFVTDMFNDLRHGTTSHAALIELTCKQYYQIKFWLTLCWISCILSCFLHLLETTCASLFQIPLFAAEILT